MNTTKRHLEVTMSKKDPYHFVHSNDFIHNSLTKREYFASMAMQGMFSQNFQLQDVKELTQIAVKCADAMIEALNNGGNNE